MTNPITRRTVLGAPLGAAAFLGLPSHLRGGTAEPPAWSSFPSQDPDRVRDTVLYSHFDLEKVKALVEASPALANAAMDWGFGDWETALGAASHMGRRDMAELLMAHGARPDLLSSRFLPSSSFAPGMHGVRGAPATAIFPGRNSGRPPTTSGSSSCWEPWRSLSRSSTC